MEKGKAPQPNDEWPLGDATVEETKEDEVPSSEPIIVQILNFDKEWPK
jgi:hypothetical protein